MPPSPNAFQGNEVVRKARQAWRASETLWGYLRDEWVLEDRIEAVMPDHIATALNDMLSSYGEALKAAHSYIKALDLYVADSLTLPHPRNVEKLEVSNGWLKKYSENFRDITRALQPYAQNAFSKTLQSGYKPPEKEPIEMSLNLVIFNLEDDIARIDNAVARLKPRSVGEPGSTIEVLYDPARLPPEGVAQFLFLLNELYRAVGGNELVVVNASAATVDVGEVAVL